MDRQTDHTAPSVTIDRIYVHSRYVNETLAYETEARPTHSVFVPRRDRVLPAIPRDRDETKTSDFCHEMRPRPCKAEAETFFDTFNLQHCAKSMNGDVQIKTVYIKQYQYLVFYSV